MEHIIEQLIEQIGMELSTANLDLDLSYALIKTTVKEYLREIKIRLILQPIASELSTAFNSIASLEQHVLRILMGLRRSGSRVLINALP